MTQPTPDPIALLKAISAVTDVVNIMRSGTSQHVNAALRCAITSALNMSNRPNAHVEAELFAAAFDATERISDGEKIDRPLEAGDIDKTHKVVVENIAIMLRCAIVNESVTLKRNARLQLLHLMGPLAPESFRVWHENFKRRPEKSRTAVLTRMMTDPDDQLISGFIEEVDARSIGSNGFARLLCYFGEIAEP